MEEPQTLTPQPMGETTAIPSTVSPPPKTACPVLGLAGWLGVTLAPALLGGLFLPGEWYQGLRKPAWNPPGSVFGPVWTGLYAAMAVAAWLVWRQGGFARQRAALAAFLVQLLFNALWSPIFFGLHRPGLAFADLLLLWLTLVATTAAFFKARPAAGWLLVPYLAWVTFAGALNFAVWRLNA